MDIEDRNRIMHELRVEFSYCAFSERTPQPAGPGAGRLPGWNSPRLHAGLRPGDIEKVQVFPTKYNQMVHAPVEEQLQNEYSEYAQDQSFALFRTAELCTEYLCRFPNARFQNVRLPITRTLFLIHGILALARPPRHQPAGAPAFSQGGSG
jgi:hypothetical protein